MISLTLKDKMEAMSNKNKLHQLPRQEARRSVLMLDKHMNLEQVQTLRSVVNNLAVPSIQDLHRRLQVMGIRDHSRRNSNNRHMGCPSSRNMVMRTTRTNPRNPPSLHMDSHHMDNRRAGMSRHKRHIPRQPSSQGCSRQHSSSSR
jgi:hypothetical protein